MVNRRRQPLFATRRAKTHVDILGTTACSPVHRAPTSRYGRGGSPPSRRVMTRAEALEARRIHRVAGLTGARPRLFGVRTPIPRE